jgi:hypothetical protein
MNHRSLIGRIAGAIGRFRRAARVATAIENGRSPRPSDLERLGISAVAFGAISHN